MDISKLTRPVDEIPFRNGHESGNSNIIYDIVENFINSNDSILELIYSEELVDELVDNGYVKWLYSYKRTWENFCNRLNVAASRLGRNNIKVVTRNGVKYLAKISNLKLEGAKNIGRYTIK